MLHLNNFICVVVEGNNGQTGRWMEDIVAILDSPIEFDEAFDHFNEILQSVPAHVQ